MRTFVFNDGKSNKFWNIDLQGASFTVTFGKVGTKGQTQTKDFPDEDRARKAYDKLVAEKLGKGYVETTVKPAGSALRQSLEQALTEDPDDLAAHSAYADLLVEEGDPRGEFIQVQLALEDPRRPAAERARLQQREAELLKRHGRDWLGDVGRFLVGKWSGEDKPWHYEFARGWLDYVRMLPFLEPVLTSLARSPEARLLRRLDVVYDMRYHPFDFDEVLVGPNKAMRGDEGASEPGSFDTFDETNVLPSLLASPYLTNLRAFRLGFSDSGERVGHSTMVGPFNDCTVGQILELLQKCPRLEELYLNTSLAGIDELFASPRLGPLRVLQYYFGMDADYIRHDGYPLAALANNASLRNLHTLRLHPGRDTNVNADQLDAVLRSPNLPNLTHLQVHMTNYENEGCRRIVDSGILRRLKVLDVGYGNMTDEGARQLAASPELKDLQLLDVSRNALTAEGIAALRATGVKVVADDQHDPDETEYLFEVDYE
ncbi:MAG: WGR domain-containing protein [Gemmataceae bacterium]